MSDFFSIGKATKAAEAEATRHAAEHAPAHAHGARAPPPSRLVPASPRDHDCYDCDLDQRDHASCHGECVCQSRVRPRHERARDHDDDGHRRSRHDSVHFDDDADPHSLRTRERSRYDEHGAAAEHDTMHGQRQVRGRWEPDRDHGRTSSFADVHDRDPPVPGAPPVSLVRSTREELRAEHARERGVTHNKAGGKSSGSTGSGGRHVRGSLRR